MLSTDDLSASEYTPISNDASECEQAYCDYLTDMLDKLQENGVELDDIIWSHLKTSDGDEIMHVMRDNVIYSNLAVGLIVHASDDLSAPEYMLNDPYWSDSGFDEVCDMFEDDLRTQVFEREE